MVKFVKSTLLNDAFFLKKYMNEIIIFFTKYISIIVSIVSMLISVLFFLKEK
jgi:hypothetical protein